MNYNGIILSATVLISACKAMDTEISSFVVPTTKERIEMDQLSQRLDRGLKQAPAEKIQLPQEVFASLQAASKNQLNKRKGELKELVLKHFIPERLAICFAKDNAKEGKKDDFEIKQVLIDFDRSIKSTRDNKSEASTMKITSQDPRLNGYPGVYLEPSQARRFKLFVGKDNTFYVGFNIDPDTTYPITGASLDVAFKVSQSSEQLKASMGEFNRARFLIENARAKAASSTAKTYEHLKKDKTIAAEIKRRYGKKAVEEFWDNTRSSALKKLIRKYESKRRPEGEKMTDGDVDEIYNDLCFETRVKK